jgi:hypothetical protein
MEIPGLFQTFAEIGVAIAGFSGLIVSLRKDVGPLKGVQKFRLRLLLNLSLGAMFLSLLPELLVLMDVDAQNLWTWCSIAALSYSIAFILWWIVASMRIYRVEPEIINWTAFSTMSAGHLIVILVLVSFLFGWTGLADSSAFSIALIWYLIHAAQQFIRMLFIPTRSDLAQVEPHGVDDL